LVGGAGVYAAANVNYGVSGLQFFVTQYGSRWDLLMAASTILMLPLVAAFLLFQRYFVEGFTLTGMKG